MSLSPEQKKDLNELSKHLRRVEEFALQNNIDLDVYMTQYSNKGIAVYSTEKVSMDNSKAAKRKDIFERTSSPEKAKVKTR